MRWSGDLLSLQLGLDAHLKVGLAVNGCALNDQGERGLVITNTVTGTVGLPVFYGFALPIR